MPLFHVIKYEGSNDILVYKHRTEDFYSGSTLIVQQSQRAVLYYDGKAVKVYSPGKHTIKTANYPLLTTIGTLFTGGIAENHYQVYFVNVKSIMDLKWGTSSPIQIEDSTGKFPVNITARGTCFVLVRDPIQLLEKLVGSEDYLSKSQLKEKIKGILVLQAKKSVSDIMIQEEKSFLEINLYLEEIAQSTNDCLNDTLMNYGLAVEKTEIAVDVVQDEYYNQYREMINEKNKCIFNGVPFNVMEYWKTLQNRGNAGPIPPVPPGPMGFVPAPPAGTYLQGGVNPLNPVSDSSVGISDNDSRFRLRRVDRKDQVSNSKHCPYCNKIIPSDSKFCNNCGKKLICPQCGKEIVSDSRFCGECGYSLANES